MPSTTDLEHDEFGDDAGELFARRVMQNALLSRIGSGIDPLNGTRLQVLGLLQHSNPPEFSEEAIAVLQDPAHPSRVGPPDGPFVFMSEPEHLSIMEAYSLLLHPERSVRMAAVRNLKAAAESIPQWLSTATLSVLEDQSRGIESAEPAEWREAGLTLMPAVRDDYARLLGALRQSLQGRYEEGIQEYLGRILCPNWNTLSQLRPGVLHPQVQAEEIDKQLADWAQMPTVWDALSQYVEWCGYLPLERARSASQLFEMWCRNHPETIPAAEQLWSWADRWQTPSAVYHALEIVLSSAPLAGENDERTMQEVLDIVGVSVRDTSDKQEATTWDLYYGLAIHFLQYLEALHPGQDGTRAAAFAWYLAEQVITMLNRSHVRIDRVMEQAVIPQSKLSHFRWTIARSPMVPSSFRYLTLFARPIWAMSLIGLFVKQDSSERLNRIREKLPTAFADAVRDYLITTPLVNSFRSEESFAFQLNMDTVAGNAQSTEVVSSDNSLLLESIVNIRKHAVDPASLREQLEKLTDLEPDLRYFVLQLLKEAIYSTHLFDTTIESWLADGSTVVNVLQALDDQEISLLLEAMAEFQQRRASDWAPRLPHLLAAAIEQTDNEPRALLLFASLLQMSINTGITSPIQRAVNSKYRKTFLDVLRSWRDNLVFLATRSEPWVAGRIRGTSAAISRLAGPRDYSPATIAEPAPG